MYYIYALIDPRTNQPFYIGKGKIANKRHLDHLKLTEDSNRHKQIRIKYLIDNGYKIQTKILETDIVNEELAYQIEEKYIKKYGRMNIDLGGILTNICLSKYPPSAKGRKQTKEHIRRRVDSYKKTIRENGRPPVSDETRKKISEANSGENNPFYGKTHSENFKKEHSERMKGNKHNAKTYRFVSPTGQEYIVTGSFAEFCFNNGLAISTMEKNMYKGTTVMNGKSKGWFVEKMNGNTQ